MTISPATAAEWLELAASVEGPNDAATVAHYVNLMRSGQWRNLLAPAAHPIVFDSAGSVRYGLQRLEACAQAGVAIRATVVRWPRHPDTPAGWAAYQAEVEAKAAEHRALWGAYEEILAERRATVV